MTTMRPTALYGSTNSYWPLDIYLTRHSHGKNYFQFYFKQTHVASANCPWSYRGGLGAKRAAVGGETATTVAAATGEITGGASEVPRTGGAAVAAGCGEGRGRSALLLALELLEGRDGRGAKGGGSGPDGNGGGGGGGGGQSDRRGLAMAPRGGAAEAAGRGEGGAVDPPCCCPWSCGKVGTGAAPRAAVAGEPVTVVAATTGGATGGGLAMARTGGMAGGRAWRGSRADPP